VVWRHARHRSSGRTGWAGPAPVFVMLTCKEACGQPPPPRRATRPSVLRWSGGVTPRAAGADQKGPRVPQRGQVAVNL